MSYVPDPFNSAEPVESRAVESAAEEFRKIKDPVTRALRFPAADLPSYRGELPAAAARAGRALVFDPVNGTPAAGPLTTDITNAASNAAAAASSATAAAASALAAANSAVEAAASAASVNGANLVQLDTVQTITAQKTFSVPPIVPNTSFSFAKVQNIASGGMLGRNSVGPGSVEELTEIPWNVGVPADRLSGTIATARLGSGTANTTTFLRGDNTWQAISLTPSTADVLNATAGAAVGAVGTYAFLARPEFSPSVTTTTTPGQTVAGSQLRYSGAPDYSATAPAGTWRCMGLAVGFGGQMTGDNPMPARVAPTLWLRIS
jgi:hypothetical protein